MTIAPFSEADRYKFEIFDQIGNNKVLNGKIIPQVMLTIFIVSISAYAPELFASYNESFDEISVENGRLFSSQLFRNFRNGYFRHHATILHSHRNAVGKSSGQ